MPSKTSQHIAFFVVLIVSMGLHWYVFNNLRRLLRRDYPNAGRRLTQIFLALFILMDMPFAFLWFQGGLHVTMALASHIIVYPFLVWQTIMLMWAAILFPFTLYRRTKVLVRLMFARMKKSAALESEPELTAEVITE